MRNVALIFIALLIGCATPHPTADRDDIAEAVLRYMFPPEGRSTPSFFAFHEYTDPDRHFLQRFLDFKRPPKPVSAAVLRGFFRYDKTTGEQGTTFVVEKITMRGMDQAEVEATIDPGGGLSASGHTYSVRKKDGKWTVTDKRMRWIA